MKKLMILALIISVTFCLVGKARAISYTYKDEVKYDLYMEVGDTVNWTFDLTGDGFNPEGSEEIVHATIELSFQDDGSGAFPILEFADLEVGENFFIWEVDTGEIAFEISSLVTLNEDGTLEATLTLLWGDVIFLGATLYASAEIPPVPEPGTALLFGPGLVLVGILRRRRVQKKRRQIA